jgi:hypothetical protein
MFVERERHRERERYRETKRGPGAENVSQRFVGNHD